MKLKDSVAWRLLRFLRYDLFAVERKGIWELNVESIVTGSSQTGVEFRVGTLTEILNSQLDDYDRNEEARAFARERDAAGDIVVMGFVEEVVVFYMWVMFGQMDLSLREYVRLPPTSAYTYKVLTREEYRGRGLLQSCYGKLASILAGCGSFETLYVAIDRSNLPSIRGHEKMGYRRVGNILSLKFLRWQRSMVWGTPMLKKLQRSGS